MVKFFILISSSLAFLAVAAGAFGSHILKKMLSPELLSIFETGVKYHMYHALALFLVAILIRNENARLLTTSGWLFIAGTVIFSGSLYILSISGIKWWGAITPLGGISFLAGWVCLIAYALQKA